jgi:hypothetical protein
MRGGKVKVRLEAVQILLVTKLCGMDIDEKCYMGEPINA